MNAHTYHTVRTTTVRRGSTDGADKPPRGPGRPRKEEPPRKPRKPFRLIEAHTVEGDPGFIIVTGVMCVELFQSLFDLD